MDALLYFNFLLAAIALLASPGPAYATVVAIGRSVGWRKGQLFNFGLQIGMGLVATLTAFGFAAIVTAYPNVQTVIGVLGASYLLYLAYKIASSPIGKAEEQCHVRASFGMGVLVGVTNPKAYAAQGALFASFNLLPNNSMMDGGLKLFSAIVVMTIAGWFWLWVGAKLGSVSMSSGVERSVNYAFAFGILFAGGFALLA